jgi:hypothetical protein
VDRLPLQRRTERDDPRQPPSHNNTVLALIMLGVVVISVNTIATRTHVQTWRHSVAKAKNTVKATAWGEARGDITDWNVWNISFAPQ